MAARALAPVVSFTRIRTFHNGRVSYVDQKNNCPGEILVATQKSLLSAFSVDGRRSSKYVYIRIFTDVGMRKLRDHRVILAGKRSVLLAYELGRDLRVPRNDR